MGKDWGGALGARKGNGDQLGATGTNWDQLGLTQAKGKDTESTGPRQPLIAQPRGPEGIGRIWGGGQRGPEGPKAGGHREDLGRTLQ